MKYKKVEYSKIQNSNRDESEQSRHSRKNGRYQQNVPAPEVLVLLESDDLLVHTNIQRHPVHINSILQL